jgi:hypothetical protein
MNQINLTKKILGYGSCTGQHNSDQDIFRVEHYRVFFGSQVITDRVSSYLRFWVVRVRIGSDFRLFDLGHLEFQILHVRIGSRFELTDSICVK